MSDDMVIKQNKVKINATVSKRIRDKADEYARSEDYGSFSNFVETAMIYYLGSLEKENELKLKEAEEDLKKKAEEDNELIKLILKLITNHPELLEEYNELRKKHPHDAENVKKVRFEL